MMKIYLAAILVISIIAAYMIINKMSSRENEPINIVNNSGKEDILPDPFKGITSSIFTMISQNDFVEEIKKIREHLRQEELKELPKSMAEVTITPELQDYFDKLPGIYEKFEYRLGLFDRLATCLGEDAPTSGHIKVGLYFELDRDKNIAIGSSGTGEDPPLRVYLPKFFDVDRDPLTKEDEEIVVNCLYEVHMGYTFDATSSLLHGSLSNVDSKTVRFEHPIAITFPLPEDDLYKFLANGPSYFK